jgi:hypothetical protein
MVGCPCVHPLCVVRVEKKNTNRKYRKNHEKKEEEKKTIGKMFLSPN